MSSNFGIETRRLFRFVTFFGALLLVIVLWQIGTGGGMPAQAEVGKVIEVEKAWTKELAKNRIYRPWTWADSEPVARLEAPDLGVSLIVLSGTDPRTLDKAPGHIAGTVPPGGAGHSIISGRSDGSFEFLDKLEPGSKLRVQRADGIWRDYRVTSTELMDSSQALLASGSGYPVLSLVARAPAEKGSPVRYVVTAEAEVGPAKLNP